MRRPYLIEQPTELLEMIFEELDSMHESSNEPQEASDSEDSGKITFPGSILNLRLVNKRFASVGRRTLRRKILKFSPLKLYNFEFHFRGSQILQLDALAKIGEWNSFTVFQMHLPAQLDMRRPQQELFTPEAFAKALEVMISATLRLGILRLTIREESRANEHPESLQLEPLERLKVHHNCWKLITHTLTKTSSSDISLNITHQTLSGLSIPTIQQGDWATNLTRLWATSIAPHHLTKLAVILSKTKNITSLYITSPKGGHLSVSELFWNQEWPKLNNLLLHDTSIQLEDILRIVRPRALPVEVVRLYNVKLLDGTWRDFLEASHLQWQSIGSYIRLFVILYDSDSQHLTDSDKSQFEQHIASGSSYLTIGGRSMFVRRYQDKFTSAGFCIDAGECTSDLA
ncbi:MAG: hypothetical protein M1831_004872 [Alyxoria varia]|nr:MAG: hypothetical protein M1831_004872 [Alyxoria varia]